MSIRRATQWTAAMFGALVALGAVSVACGAQDAPRTAAEALARGSVQVVLAVCLVAVTLALCWTGKLLVHAYEQRIDALEKAVSMAATSSAAQTTLANAITTISYTVDRLQTHCEGRALRGG